MKKLNIKKVIIGIVCLLIICASILIGVYFYLISSTSKNSEEVSFYVDEGSSYSMIGNKLKEKGLIRSTIAYKVYLKLN